MIKILAFDLDDTALTSGKRVTARTRAAILRAVDMGVLAIPCTGREYEDIPDDVLAIPGIRYYIVNNGAQVISLPGREVIYSRTLGLGVAVPVLLECRRFNTFVYASVGSSGIFDSEGAVWKNDTAKAIARKFFGGWNFHTADLLEIIEANGNRVHKLEAVVFDADERARIRSALSGRPGIDITSSGEWNLEIMPPDTSKGAALRFICSLTGADMKDVMAVGDNMNDLDMVAEAGIGVAMGDSVQELVEIADWLTLGCDEDGLAIAIEKYILGDGY